MNPSSDTPRSFRIDKKALGVLQSEARRQRVTLSSIVNKLITSYVEYGRFAEQAHAISLSQYTFSLLLNAIGDEDLIAAAERAGKSASGFVKAVHGRLTLLEIRRFISDLSAHANMFGFNEGRSIEGSHMVLLHELGPKWSLFLSHYIGELFASAKLQVRTEISDRSVTFWPQT